MKDITVVSFPKEGYQPLVDFEGWRVAVLRYCNDTTIDAIKTMQRHEKTDEVFVLISGSCTLFTAGDADKPGELVAWYMETDKVYNVKKGVWHNHILNEDGVVCIIENQNTSDENSPIINLTKEEILYIKKLV
ncbi:MAG: hypothetical protein R3Y47_12610 [Lachnospiraceae bacterium]